MNNQRPMPHPPPLWWLSASLSAVLFIFTVSMNYAEEPSVRVAILEETPTARVTILAPCRLIDLKTKSVLGQPESLKWELVEAGDPGLKIGHRSFPTQAVLLEPVEEETLIRVNAKPYRGSLIVQRTPNGRVTVVNHLNLEQYLVGALASEVDARWPIEALKAHAVVSRTMVAHRIWIQWGRPFDVTADTSTHLYHGTAAEKEQTRSAVKATKGQVLSYHGELFSASFHASCGGHTEDASELWAVRGKSSPLKARPDPYCKNLKHYRWHVDFPKKAFTEALGKIADEIGQIQGCEVVERNTSDRVRQIRLLGDHGSASLSGRKLREFLGANRLKSLKFTVTTTPQKFSFDGFGWGHGVGLCQWGAYGMAKKGHSMDEILAFYFPDTQRRSLRGLPGFTRKE